MSSALPSSPPLALAAPQAPIARKPVLKKCGSLPRREQVRDVVARWCEQRRVSRRDLAAILDVSKSRVDDFFDCEAPFPVDGLLAFASRDGLDLWNEIHQLLMSRRSA